MNKNAERTGRPLLDPPTPLGARLQALRLDRGLTLKELAEKAGVSKEAINGIERGIRDPRLFTAICLADALGVSLDFLVMGRGTP